MSIGELSCGLQWTLLALGVLFLMINLKVGSEVFHWWRLRRSAVLVWASPKPPFYGINLAIGVMMGVTLLGTVGLIMAGRVDVTEQVFPVWGELMMFIYYGYMLPLSTQIRRGLYAAGIWTDAGYMRYADMGGLSWKSDDTLVMASRRRASARTLQVPGTRIGEVRRDLRERIAAHAIEFDGGPGIHLGTRDTRESV